MDTYDVAVELPCRSVMIPIAAHDEDEAKQRARSLCRELGWVLPHEINILAVTKR